MINEKFLEDSDIEARTPISSIHTTGSTSQETVEFIRRWTESLHTAMTQLSQLQTELQMAIADLVPPGKDMSRLRSQYGCGLLGMHMQLDEARVQASRAQIALEEVTAERDTLREEVAPHPGQCGCMDWIDLAIRGVHELEYDPDPSQPDLLFLTEQELRHILEDVSPRRKKSFSCDERDS